jgi:hypothetical protein
MLPLSVRAAAGTPATHPVAAKAAPEPGTVIQVDYVGLLEIPPLTVCLGLSRNY